MYGPRPEHRGGPSSYPKSLLEQIVNAELLVLARDNFESGCHSSSLGTLKQKYHMQSSHTCTEPRKKVGTWLRDISSWPCLAFLPGRAWL